MPAAPPHRGRPPRRRALRGVGPRATPTEPGLPSSRSNRGKGQLRPSARKEEAAAGGVAAPVPRETWGRCAPDTPTPPTPRRPPASLPGPTARGARSPGPNPSNPGPTRQATQEPRRVGLEARLFAQAPSPTMRAPATTMGRSDGRHEVAATEQRASVLHATSGPPDSIHGAAGQPPDTSPEPRGPNRIGARGARRSARSPTRACAPGGATPTGPTRPQAPRPDEGKRARSAQEVTAGDPVADRSRARAPPAGGQGQPTLPTPRRRHPEVTDHDQAEDPAGLTGPGSTRSTRTHQARAPTDRLDAERTPTPATGPTALGERRELRSQGAGTRAPKAQAHERASPCSSRAPGWARPRSGDRRPRPTPRTRRGAAWSACRRAGESAPGTPAPG